MDKRFSVLFNITEETALRLLQTPLEELDDPSARYAAACHLVHFKSPRTIRALIEAIENCDDQLYNRITRRKAIETLGRFKAQEALPVIRKCLADDDCYTVENAVWAIGEIGTTDESLLQEITALLAKPGQNYRVIIQTLARLHYQPAASSIRPFLTYNDDCVVSAAISALARLAGDYSPVSRLLEFLQSPNVNVRRGVIQDLMDLNYYPAIPAIASCPVSIVFRLRGIRHLGENAITQGVKPFSEIEPYLDQVIYDDPYTLELVHEYDAPPTIHFLLQELYHTDFGRCYLAAKTLLQSHSSGLGEVLMETWRQEAHNDYGAHYHVIRLWGRLKYQPAFDLLVEALENTAPQFQKSRAAAALALANFGGDTVLHLLRKNVHTDIFDLKYACLLALSQLGDWDTISQFCDDSDILISEKAKSILSKKS